MNVFRCVYDKENDNVVNFTVGSDDRILRVGKGHQRFIFLYQVIRTRRSILVYSRRRGHTCIYNALYS